jgi:hypothetical protein
MTKRPKRNDDATRLLDAFDGQDEERQRCGAWRHRFVVRFHDLRRRLRPVRAGDESSAAAFSQLGVQPHRAAQAA